MPLEEVHYDPGTMSPPPAAHGDPHEDDREPEPDDAPPAPAEAKASDRAEKTTTADRSSDSFESPGLFDTDEQPDHTEPADTEPNDTAEPARRERVARVADQDEPAASQPRRRTRKSGRPSVPSWDDIMFGAPRGQNH